MLKYTDINHHLFDTIMAPEISEMRSQNRNLINLLLFTLSYSEFIRFLYLSEKFKAKYINIFLRVCFILQVNFGICLPPSFLEISMENMYN